MTSANGDHFALHPVPVPDGSGLVLDVPAGWEVTPGPPLVAVPAAWPGEPPAIVVMAEGDDLAGEKLAALLARAAATRLADAVVVDLVHRGPDVETVVAHRNRGVDVTTIERHHHRPGAGRWVVACTAADQDVPRLAPLMHHVVASLRAGAGRPAGP